MDDQAKRKIRREGVVKGVGKDYQKVILGGV